MSFLNFYLGRICYIDASPVQNPMQKNFDFLLKKEGVVVNEPVSISKMIAPGQEEILNSSARVLAANMSTTEFELSKPLSGSDLVRMRFTGTGTAPAFRVLRAVNYGATPATTMVTVSRLSGTAAKLDFVGSGVDFSAALVGDEVYLESSTDTFTSPLNPNSTGRAYRVLASSALSLTVRDDGLLSPETGIVLGAGFSSVIRVHSSTGVRVGDRIRFNQLSAFNLENKSSELTVEAVTDRDLFFFNPNFIPETVVSGVAVPFSVFDKLLSFIAIESSAAVKIKVDGTSEFRMSELCGSCFFAGSLSAITVSVVNESTSDIHISAQTCSV
jgi:hypothetical protein